VLLDLLNENLLQLHWSNILSALESFVKLFALYIGFNSLVEVSDCLINFSCTLVFLNVDESFSQKLSDFIYSVFGIRHSQVETVVPDFLKLISIVEVLLSNL